MAAWEVQEINETNQRNNSLTRDELLQFHEELCLEGRELMNLKNRDYAGNHGTEPFANFTRCEAMGICETEQGFMVRITDKMSRLSSFLDSGKMHVQDESFKDTIIDVINYMVLLAAYTKDKDNLSTEEYSASTEERPSEEWSLRTNTGLYCKDS